MCAKLRFTPLYPPSLHGASCFLLEVANCRVLLDCGWAEPYDVGHLTRLREVAADVDVVLLSHADPAHTGALPYAVTHFGLDATVLCTHPVARMGQMFLYDTAISHQAMEDFDQMSLDEIDGAVSKMIAVKYNQEYFLEEFGLTISARNCGRTVGGAAWLISKDVYDIVYAVDYGHQRDKQALPFQVADTRVLSSVIHLNGFQFEDLQKPTLLITDSKHIQRPELDRDKSASTLLWTALQTLRLSGHVLIPTDTAGRVLDLVLLLEEYWAKNKLEFHLLFLGPVSYSTVTFASCQLEWMQSSITDAFEKDRDNPFDCRCMKFCNTREDYEKFGDEPKLVLASHASLQTGFARELAVEWMENDKNAILMTEPPTLGSLAHMLLQSSGSDTDETLEIQMSKRVPLVGEELEAYEAEKEKQRKASEENDEVMDVDERSEASSLSMTVDEEKDGSGAQKPGGTASKSSRVMKTLSLEIEETQNEIKHYYLHGVLIDGFQLPESSLHAAFPLEARSAPEWSVYGEAVDAENLFPAQSGQDEQMLPANAPIPVTEEVKEIPSKIVSEQLRLSLRAKVELYDMTASTNQHFMQHFLSYLQPRNLILVNGSVTEQEAFRRIATDACPQLRATGRILCPREGERVEVDEDLNSFGIPISKDLFNKALWKTTGGVRLAWVQGVLSRPDPEKEELLLERAEEEEVGIAESLCVGDSRLSQIRNTLRAKQLDTEFVGGVLVCNGSVSIRVGASQNLAIEGPISLDYYLVRRAIDEMYKIK